MGARRLLCLTIGVLAVTCSQDLAARAIRTDTGGGDWAQVAILLPLTETALRALPVNWPVGANGKPLVVNALGLNPAGFPALTNAPNFVSSGWTSSGAASVNVFNPNFRAYNDAQLLPCIAFDPAAWGACHAYFEDDNHVVRGLDLQWRSNPASSSSVLAQVLFFELGSPTPVSIYDAAGTNTGAAVGAWEVQFNCNTSATSCTNGASLEWEGQLYTASQAVLISRDPNFPAIEPALNQFVFNNGRLYPPPGWLAATSTVLTLSASSVTSGTAVTLTAVVDEVRDATPTGTVTFRNGTTVLGTQTLNSSGVAALTIPNLAVGTYSVIATYEGDKTAASSTSTSASLAVNAPPQPTVSVSVAPTTIQTGQTATLSWTSSNATSCTASGAWTGSQSGSGTQNVTASSAGTQSFAISCTGPGGTANASTTLTVTAPPPPPSTTGNSGGGGGGGGSLSMWDLLAFGFLAGLLAHARRRVLSKHPRAIERPTLDTVWLH